MSQQFNFGDWVRRLGYKRTDEPEIQYNVQPVMLVADVSTLTPEIRAPSAIFGGVCLSAAANFATYSFLSGSAGGAVIGSFSVHPSGTNSSLVWSIQDARPIFLGGPGVVASIPQVMQGPIQSTAECGRVLVGSLSNNGRPQTPAGAQNIPSFWPEKGIWIPPGRRLVIQQNNLAINLSIAHTVQERPADPSGT